jgi:hypothetical protein
MWLSEGVDVFCIVEGIRSVFLHPIFTAGTGQVRSLALVLILWGEVNPVLGCLDSFPTWSSTSMPGEVEEMDLQSGRASSPVFG